MRKYLLLLLLLLSVQHVSGVTLGQTEYISYSYDLEEGDSIKIEVSVSSGSLEISLLDNTNYNDFISAQATYHEEWERDIRSSKTFTFRIDSTETWWVVFWCNGGSVTFTYTIDVGDQSLAELGEMAMAIGSAVGITVVILVLNARQSKIPRF